LADAILPLLRSRIYKILSLCLVYPDDDSFSYMAKEAAGDLQECLARLPYGEALADPMQAFRSAVEKEVVNGKLLDLQVEHTSMFIYPRPEIPCPPYESIYVEKVRRLMGDSTMDVKKRYNEHKLALSDQFKDLPDHVSAELEFMHYLAYSEAEANAAGKTEESASFAESEKSFLADHLLRWLPKFADCLKAKSSSGLIVSASRMASEFAAEDLKFLTGPRG